MGFSKVRTRSSHTLPFAPLLSQVAGDVALANNQSYVFKHLTKMILPSVILKAAERAKELAAHSWEYGTVSDTLLELFSPDLSVFGDPGLGGQIPIPDVEQVPALVYAKDHIRLVGSTLIDGDGKLNNSNILIMRMLMIAGAAGDPASLGVASILLGQRDSAYLEAAERQYDTLCRKTPRLSSGAISHRENVAEAWSDFVYMAPPFIAYYALAKRDNEALDMAVQQCLLYKKVLQGRDGLWHHIIGPENEDLGMWSTGNGWAALGMTRVLASLIKSGANHDKQEELLDTIRGILEGAMKHDRDPKSQLIRNYIPDNSWFGDNAGTAALAATAYRLAALYPARRDDFAQYLQWAEESRHVVLQHIEEDTGLVSPVANPMDSRDRKPCKASAEGQCFALLMYTAHRDWMASI
jgi:hypothetical protein